MGTLPGQARGIDNPRLFTTNCAARTRRGAAKRGEVKFRGEAGNGDQVTHSPPWRLLTPRERRTAFNSQCRNEKGKKALRTLMPITCCLRHYRPSRAPAQWRVTRTDLLTARSPSTTVAKLSPY